MPAESELMRICAPLYPSFALESAASLVLFLFFSYLSILISSKQQLQAPARSICKFVYTNVVDWAVDTNRILSRWPRMHEMDMGQRFRFCRRLNATICRVSAFIGLISITRWLHFNNVNGFRYLGYAFTCPMMQAELVLLIAPVVPCYRFVVMLTTLATFAMLVCGWTSSQFDGPIWETDWQDIVFEQNLHNLTTKGWLIVPSVCVLSFLSFVQIPLLGLLFYCNGGSDGGKLPHGYPTLLLLTSITWWGFPAWWMLSFEGMGVIEDTKLNGVGFVVLNMISKGGFTLHMLSMVKYYKRNHAANQQALAGRDRSGSVTSLDSLPELPGVKSGQKVQPPAPESDHLRQERVLPTGQSLNWFVEHMKQYEEGHDAREVAPVAPAALAAKDAKPVMVRDASLLSNDELLQELAKRLGSAAAPSPRTFEKSLDVEIRRACTQLAICEDSDED